MNFNCILAANLICLIATLGYCEDATHASFYEELKKLNQSVAFDQSEFDSKIKQVKGLCGNRLIKKDELLSAIPYLRDPLFAVRIGFYIVLARSVGASTDFGLSDRRWDPWGHSIVTSRVNALVVDVLRFESNMSGRSKPNISNDDLRSYIFISSFEDCVYAFTYLRDPILLIRLSHLVSISSYLNLPDFDLELVRGWEVESDEMEMLLKRLGGAVLKQNRESPIFRGGGQTGGKK